MEIVSGISTRVLVVDDHIMVSELLALSISKEPDLALVGVVGTVDEALELVARERPDVVLVNYRLPDFDCVDVVRRLVKESPLSRVVMLSGNGDQELQRKAIEAGCAGLVGKNAKIGEVLEAIRVAARVGAVVDTDESRMRRYA